MIKRMKVFKIFKDRKNISIFIIIISIMISITLILNTPQKKENNKNEDSMFLLKTDESKNIKPLLTFEDKALENLTLKFANNLAKTALEKNFYQDQLNRPAIINPQDPSPIKETIDKIIEEEFNTSPVKESDILVNDNNSPEIQKIYLLYLNQIIVDIPSFGKIEENGDLKEIFLGAANNLEKAIQLLKIVHVPPSWVDIHYKVLTLLYHQRNIFIALSKNIDDPVRFLVALYQIKQDPFETGLKILRKEIEQKIKNEKLI